MFNLHLQSVPQATPCAFLTDQLAGPHLLNRHYRQRVTPNRNLQLEQDLYQYRYNEMAAESDTNSLTMKLLALAGYCEGSKAQEIKNVIAQLPAAAYRERTAADTEVNRLRSENSHLKQRLALEALALRQPARPPSPPRSSWRDRESPRIFPDLSSSVKSQYGSKYTPSLPKELFPETSRSPIKRPRRETPPPSLMRARPVCTGCFQNGIPCDGKSECSACHKRGYGCEYNECWEHKFCADMMCTRLHPEQWNGGEEPRRIVKTKRR